MCKSKLLKTSVYLAVILIPTQLWGQLAAPGVTGYETDPVAMKFAATISEDDLKEYLNILASDALEGRETGTRGQKMAAAFIAQHFLENHLTAPVPNAPSPAFLQPFKLYRNSYENVYVRRDEQTLRHMEEVLFFGDVDIPQEQNYELRFVGQGETENYRDLQVEGTMVAFYASSRNDRSRKIKIAQDQGAAAFFVINHDSRQEFEEYVKDYGHFFQRSSISAEVDDAGELLVFFGPPEVVADLLSTKVDQLRAVMDKQGNKNPLRKIKSSNIKVNAPKVSEEFITENVLGYLEGTDKKDELVVITAHYDHEGTADGEVYNGADDDGSGTAAVMELAQAFSLAKEAGHGPRRSLLFMAVTGEEKGLLGSSYYVDNPVVPLENTVANLNIDMIGRVDKNHQELDNYVYVIGADRLSQELHDINEGMNQLYTKMDLDYTYNAPSDPNRFYYRSDHYNFAKHNIPIIFYFNGTHEDYHRPTDTVDKIRFDLLKLRTNLIYYTAWELANREQRIKLNE